MSGVKTVGGYPGESRCHARGTAPERCADAECRLVHYSEAQAWDWICRDADALVRAAGRSAQRGGSPADVESAAAQAAQAALQYLAVSQGFERWQGRRRCSFSGGKCWHCQSTEHDTASCPGRYRGGAVDGTYEEFLARQRGPGASACCGGEVIAGLERA